MSKITVILADDHTLVRKGIKAMLESDPEITVVAEADNGREALEQARNFSPDLLVMDVRMPVMNGLDACMELPSYAPGTKAVILSMHDSDDYVLQSLSAGAWGYLLKDIDRNEFIKALKQVHGGNKYFTGAVSNALANQLLKGGSVPFPAAAAVASVPGSSPASGSAADTDPAAASAAGPTASADPAAGADPAAAAAGRTDGHKAQSDPYGLTRREREILRLVVNGKQNKQISESLGKSIRTVETHRFNIMKKLGVNNAVDMVNKVIREKLL